MHSPIIIYIQGMASMVFLTLGTCARVTVVVLCVCVCTKLAATYLNYMMKVRCHQAFYAELNVCIVWMSLKTLRSKFLATFADHRCLLRFLTSSQWTKETVMASFQEHLVCRTIVIALITRLAHHWSQ